MSAEDVGRIFVCMLGSLVILTTLSIVVSYARLHRALARPGPKFLPHHIATIAAAFVLLSTYGMAELIGRWEEPLTWRGPWLLAAFALANVAQALMLHVVRCQIRDHDEASARRA